MKKTTDFPKNILTSYSKLCYTISVPTSLSREFEFSLEKDAKNWREHQVHLATAALVFVDPRRVERGDDSEGNTSGEERWQTLGKADKVLFVVYTERGEITRLISARPASKAEKRSYYGHDESNRKGWTKAD
jgi:uncharacterized DUF497 family protein